MRRILGSILVAAILLILAQPLICCSVHVIPSGCCSHTSPATSTIRGGCIGCMQHRLGNVVAASPPNEAPVTGADSPIDRAPIQPGSEAPVVSALSFARSAPAADTQEYLHKIGVLLI
jgi:hypothetical protein